jgi:hypothetical protein
LYLQGRFPFDRMITFYPFSEISKAAEDMEKGTVLKPYRYSAVLLNCFGFLIYFHIAQFSK